MSDNWTKVILALIGLAGLVVGLFNNQQIADNHRATQQVSAQVQQTSEQGKANAESIQAVHTEVKTVVPQAVEAVRVENMKGPWPHKMPDVPVKQAPGSPKG